jgi:acetylornithine aminotransferase
MAKQRTYLQQVIMAQPSAVTHLLVAQRLRCLKTLSESSLITDVTHKGDGVCQGSKNALQDNSHIVDIRHQGLMIGIELDQPCANLVAQALKSHLI